MLDHVSIAVSDLARAVAFYDAIMRALGHERIYLTDHAAGYGTRNSADDDSHSYLTIVADDATIGGDRHWAFRAPSRAAVDAFHRAARNGRSDHRVG